MTMSSEPVCDIVADTLAYFENIQADIDKGASAISLLTSCVCLVLALLVNIYIAVNIIYRKKFQIRYFKTFLLLLFVQLLYLVVSIVAGAVQLLPQCLPEPGVTDGLRSLATPLTRAMLGLCGCMVGALTVERFLSATVSGPILRGFLNSLALLLCVGAPVALVTCSILIKYDVIRTWSWLDLDSEYWFGLEICVYVIFPLLLLTIFGTVNCCRVANSSRMLPTHQIQAIKINIGVTITTNIALFLFLVQESLGLWHKQLLDRKDDPEFTGEVDGMVGSVTLTGHIVSTLLTLMVSMVGLLYCCIASDCCHECCCSSINDLEQVRYEQVESKDVL